MLRYSFHLFSKTNTAACGHLARDSTLRLAQCRQAQQPVGDWRDIGIAKVQVIPE